jgi:serine/threonine-protein kinase HipA
MAAVEKGLIVFANLDANWVPCGQLTLTEDGPTALASSFAYGLRYLQRANAIEIDPVSLGLQNRENIRGKMLFPANNLPLFGGIRDAAPDAWGRRVIEAKLKAPANSLSESIYLLHAGNERVGALDVRTTLYDSPYPSSGNWNSLQYLMEAADRIENGLPIPVSLEAIFQDGSSLGGARPKASVRDNDNVLWLAKFSSRTDRYDIPAIEAATLRLASACGLTVPPVKFLPLCDRNIMMIRRFDRYWSTPGITKPNDWMTAKPAAGQQEQRIAFISGLTLLGCDETQSPTKSYAELAHAIRRYCHTSVIRRDNRELFGRMVYNILVSNDDDHLRNHGFMWDSCLPGWRLSPLYDVMPRPGLAFERQLHLGIGQQGRAATLDNAMTAKEAFSLSERDATEVIEEVWSQVREWRVYFEQYNVSAMEIEKISSAFRHIDDVSSTEFRRKLP